MPFRFIALITLMQLGLTACVTSEHYVKPDNQTVDKTFDSDEAASARLVLGLHYLTLKDFPRALQNLQQALHYAPNRADVHYSLAHYYQQVAELDNAEKHYQIALQLEPNNPDTFNNYAVFLCQQGRYVEAEGYFLQAISTPGYVAVGNSYVNLSQCALSSGELSKSYLYLRRARDYKPNDFDLLFEQAKLSFIKGDIMEARGLLAEFHNTQTATKDSAMLAYLIAKQEVDHPNLIHWQIILSEHFPNSKENLMVLAEKTDLHPWLVIKTANGTNDVAVSAHSETLQALAEPSAADEPTELELQQTTAQADIIARPDWLDIPQVKVKIPRHIVADGENLYRISLRYNIRMSSLMKWNKLANQNVISGQRLYIMNPDVYYVVQESQTLSSIAKTLKVPLDDIMAWNKVASDGLVKSGTKIIKVNLEKYKDG